MRVGIFNVLLQRNDVGDSNQDKLGDAAPTNALDAAAYY
jgi:hypothetical protein